MSECITFINQKGGVGKTTVCHAFAAALADKEYKVLVVDLDPQGNLTFSLNAEAGNTSALLRKETGILDCLREIDQMDLLPSDLQLSSLNTSLTEIGKEYRLREALASIRDDYDYILIDTPPSLGILTVNALVASDSIIIPAHTDIYSLQGIGQLYQTIETIKKYCNPELTIKGIILNRFNSRTIISRDMEKLLEETAEQMNTRLFKTKIRECTALKEAAAKKESIFNYNKRSNASQDFYALIEEFLNE